MNAELLATFEVISLFEKSKSLSDQILDGLPNVLVYMDEQSKILRCNRQLANLLNSGTEDLLFRKLESYFGEDGRAVFAEQLARTRNGEPASVEFELPLPSADGRSRDFLWQISPIAAAKNQAPVFICMGHDITEVKAAQMQIANLAKDLELAEALQNLLLPAENSLRTPSLDVAAYYKSAAVSGGDFWFIEFIEGGKTWVMIGDVTGHGAGAAMVTALVTGCVRTLLSAAKSKSMQVTLPTVLKNIDETLMAIPDQPYWMTMIAVEIDPKTDALNWWSAGSPPAYKISADGTVDWISDRSTPLGSGQLRLSSGSESFVAGQKLLLITDGVTETKNPAGQDFERRGFKKYLAQLPACSAFEARDRLAAELSRWREEGPMDDDITFVVLTRK